MCSHSRSTEKRGWGIITCASPKEPKLTELQADVLKWAYDGCPDDVSWTANRERIAARSLASRGLLEVEGKGATWRATITKAGREWMVSKVLPYLCLIGEAADLWVES